MEEFWTFVMSHKSQHSTIRISSFLWKLPYSADSFGNIYFFSLAFTLGSYSHSEFTNRLAMLYLEVADLLKKMFLVCKHVFFKSLLCTRIRLVKSEMSVKILSSSWRSYSDVQSLKLPLKSSWSEEHRTAFEVWHEYLSLKCFKYRMMCTHEKTPA